MPTSVWRAGAVVAPADVGFDGTTPHDDGSIEIVHSSDPDDPSSLE